jgi:superfamily II DNA/RNA helicase
LGVPAILNNVLAGLGIDSPTPIQAATLPDALAGRDVLGRGRTGSGKTYAFALPLVARLSGGRRAGSKAPRALILAPTRELASQIDAVLAPLARAAGLTTRTVFGGVGQKPQVTALHRGVDILVACPGRLEDLIGQGHCTLAGVEVTVLDEADHMADLGFLPAVRRLLAQTPRGSQRLLFSATLDRAIDSLVRQFLTDPVTHEADSARSPVQAMSHHVLHVERAHRLPILVDLTSAPGRTVVFTRTKRGAKTLARQLNSSGVPTVELHGNLGQTARTRNLEAFQSGSASALVATDIAARGIHVDDVTLVVHADPPSEHKAYLHRSGRTARAGNAGIVVTLMTSEQVRDVRALTRAAGIAPTTTRIQGTCHPVLAELAPGERVLSGSFQAAATTGSAPKSSSKSSPSARNRRRRGQKRRSGESLPEATKPQRSSSPSAPGQRSPSRRSADRTPPTSTRRRSHSAAAFSSGRR